MNQSRKSDPDFCLQLSVSPKPIILLGVGVFLPHGENIRGNLRIIGIAKYLQVKSTVATIIDRSNDILFN